MTVMINDTQDLCFKSNMEKVNFQS